MKMKERLRIVPCLELQFFVNVLECYISGD